MTCVQYFSLLRHEDVICFGHKLSSASDVRPTLNALVSEPRPRSGNLSEIPHPQPPGLCTTCGILAKNSGAVSGHVCGWTLAQDSLGMLRAGAVGVKGSPSPQP